MSTSPVLKAEFTKSDFWNSSFYAFDYCLSLGWSPAAYKARATSVDAIERSWLLSLATDSSFAIAPPWSTYRGRRPDYAAELFKRSWKQDGLHFEPMATPIAVPIFPPPLDSFRVAHNHSVWKDLLVPAAEVVDPLMLRPLVEFAADGSLIPPPSLQELPLSPLIIHNGSHGDDLYIIPFWKSGSSVLNWSQKEDLKRAFRDGVLIAVKYIHDITTATEEGRKLKWESIYSFSPMINTADFKLVSKAQDQSSVIMTIEVEPLGKKALSLKRTRPRSWLLEADAKLGKAIRNAEHEGASIACIHGGAGILIILERVHIKEEQYDWVIWPEIIAHMALADAAVGEAGPNATAYSSQGERTLPVDAQDLTVLTKYGIVPILVGLAEYAKRARRKHAFKPLNLQNEGHVAVNGMSKAATSARSTARKRQKTDKGVLASPSIGDDSKCIDGAAQAVPPTSASCQLSFVLGQKPFAQGERADIWVAYRSQDSPKLINNESVFYKMALPCGFQPLDDVTMAPLDVEVSTYERAKKLQGRYIPKLIAVVHDKEALAHSAEHKDIDGGAIKPGIAQATALVLSNTGVYLQILSCLGSQRSKDVTWACERLPVGFLADLARCFVKIKLSSAETAAGHIGMLTKEALEAFHKCNLTHNSTYARNICLRINEQSELCVSLIDFERSKHLSQHKGTRADWNYWKIHDTDKAKEQVREAIAAFWPAMELTMAQLTGDESVTCTFPFAILVKVGALF